MNGRFWLWSGLGLAVLGTSLAGNFIMASRMEKMEDALQKAANGKAVPVSVKSAPTVSAGQAENKPAGYAPALPPTPVLLKSASAEEGKITLHFASGSPLAVPSVSISPEISATCAADGNKIVLQGEFRPGMKYRVTVTKGMKNAEGGVLEHDAVAEITIPDLEPGLEFVTTGTYLPLCGKKLVLPFRTVNCPKIEVTVSRAFENNLNPYFGMEYAADRRMVPVAKKRLKSMFRKIGRFITNSTLRILSADANRAFTKLFFPPSGLIAMRFSGCRLPIWSCKQSRM